MTISKEQLEEIKTLRQRTDVAELAKLTNTPKSTLYVIMNTGECSTRVASKILKFYKRRKEEKKALETIMPQDQD